MAIKPITETLARLRGGLLLDEASEKMAQIVRAVDVKLRYKVKDAKLTLWYELQRPDLIVDDAIKETMKDIGEQTEVTVIFGTP